MNEDWSGEPSYQTFCLFITVQDYMKLFGQVSEPNPSELLRHSVHQMHLVSTLEEAHFSDHDPDFFQPTHLITIMPG